MIEQRDDSVTVSGRPLLGAVYRSVLLGVAHRRANGVPSLDLQQLAKLLYRAYMSPQRHEIATAADDQPCSNSQDGELIDSAEGAQLLAVSRRQAQRLAANSGADLATRCGQIWLYRRAAVQALKQLVRERRHHDQFRTDGTHRQAPLFNVALRLNTLEQARERYRVWASAQWEQQHSGPQVSWIDKHGQLHERPRPTNPFKAEELAT
jgi:hypothetical protein